MGQMFVAVVLLLVLFAAPSRAESQLERGRYLVETVAACGNCHTPKGPNGPLTDKKLAGGDIIKHADFTAATANITPDPETGIGKWTDRQIFAAIREGRRLDGTLIGPAMPSRSYRYVADEDVEPIDPQRDRLRLREALDALRELRPCAHLTLEEIFYLAVHRRIRA